MVRENNSSKKSSEIELDTPKKSLQTPRAFDVSPLGQAVSVWNFVGICQEIKNLKTEREIKGFSEAAIKISKLFGVSILDQYKYLSEFDANSFVDDSQLLQTNHMLWSLMEILYESSYYNNDDIEYGLKFVKCFSNWYSHNFPIDLSQPIDFLIYRHLIQGNLEKSLQLMDIHQNQLLSRGNSQVFGFEQTTTQLYYSLIDFISLHPILNPSTFSSDFNLLQFTQRRSILKMKALAFNQKDSFLYKACLIVVGNVQFLLEFSENWIEYLIASHLYISDQSFSYQSRFDLARQCYSELGELDEQYKNPVELSILSMLSANFGELFVHVSNTDLWLSAHLINFYCCTEMCPPSALKM
ncbi:hypothetical protein AYI68_g3386 [Smittium mucronatum]|uniref:Nuclear pore complex protein Nup85 n=1 Tax=Smittium mucronatum TaxID=133383 RepID=A0A1R0H043_9FUNG|nr:hypothetical protein AYI68_g3386 [Smittium mucronatum]